MDQTTPDPAPTPSPEPLDSADGPRPPDERGTLPCRSVREDRTAQRLQTRIESSEPVVAWTRGWVSRDIRLHRLVAARTLDFAVLTDHWLFLLNTGFFTRRPRRCVYAARLAEIFVTEVPRRHGHRLRIASPQGRPLRFELRANPQADAFASELVARAQSAPDGAGTT